MLTIEQEAIVNAQISGNGLECNTIVSTNAGTGKTHTIKAIVRTVQSCFTNNEVWVLVCAPTAQAARTAGHSYIDGAEVPAETIAWLIAKGDAANAVVWDKVKLRASTGQLKAFKLIADEFSMINYREWVQLCTRLYSAVLGTPCKVSIVLFGDVKQLPAVEADGGGCGLLKTMLLKSSQAVSGRSRFQQANYTLAGFLHKSEVQAFELTQSLRFRSDAESDMHRLSNAIVNRNPNIVLGYMRCLEPRKSRPLPLPGVSNSVVFAYDNETVDLVNRQAAIYVGLAQRIVYCLVDDAGICQTVLVESGPIIGTVNVRVPKSSDFYIANGQVGTCDSVLGTEAPPVATAFQDCKKRFLRIDKHLAILINLPKKGLVSVGIKIVDKVKTVPVKMAWASTIHKIQGATVESPTKVVVDMKKFTDIRVLYVAITRVEQIEQLYFVNVNPEAITAVVHAAQDDATAAFLKRFCKLLLYQLNSV